MNEAKRLRKGFIVAVAMMLVCFTSGAAMAANKLIVKDSTGTTDKFVVTDRGRIGIGSSAPDSGIVIQTTDDNDARMKAQLTTTVSYASPGFAFYRNNPNGGADKLPLLGDKLGYLTFGSMFGTTPRNGAGVFGYAGGNWSAESSPAYIAFETTLLTTRVERARIDSNGNVGIGVTNPAQKLEINGGVRLNTTAAKPTCTAAIRGTLWFTQGSTDILEICAQVSGGPPIWRQITLN